jgi:outer membrane protein assembly factor BamB
MRLRILISAALILIAAVAAVSVEEESPLIYFRWDGGVAGKEAGSLPENLDSPNVLRWRTPIDSGHSTPISCGGRIFLTTYGTRTNELATLAIAIDTGKVLWKQIARATSIEEYNQMTGSPAQATPACDGQRLYVFFGSYGLICYDLQGKLLWEQRMGPFQDEYGSGSSPVLVDDKVIIQQDHDAKSFLMALDSKSGKVLWKSERPDAVRSYSTPAVWTRNGRKELLVAGAIELAGYDPSNGKRLWWTYGLARIVIPTPVPAGDVVYMASWTSGGDSGQRSYIESWPEALRKYDRNGDGKLSRYEIFNPEIIERFFRIDTDQSGDLNQAEWERQAVVFRRAQNGTQAIKPQNMEGELKESAVVWRCDRGAPYVATPLLDRGILWMVKDGGIVTKISAATGTILQEKRLPSYGNYYSSPVSADGKIYFASQQGVVSVIANESQWRPISSHDFMEKIYATPLASDGCLFIRTERALYCLGTPSRHP